MARPTFFSKIKNKYEKELKGDLAMDQASRLIDMLRCPAGIRVSEGRREE